MLRLASLLVACAAAVPALGQTQGYQAVTCSTSERQGPLTTCDRFATITLAADGSGSIQGLRVTAPSAHCSPVAYSVVRYPYVTGADVLAVSSGLRPGESQVLNLGRGFARGTHELRVQAVGFVADCNVGRMHSWGINWAFTIIPE